MLHLQHSTKAIKYKYMFMCMYCYVEKENEKFTAKRSKGACTRSSCSLRLEAVCAREALAWREWTSPVRWRFPSSECRAAWRSAAERWRHTRCSRQHTVQLLVRYQGWERILKTRDWFTRNQQFYTYVYVQYFNYELVRMKINTVTSWTKYIYRS